MTQQDKDSMNNYVLLSGSCEDCAWNVDNHYNPMCAHCPNCTYSKYDLPMFVKREQEGKRMISYDRLLELAKKMHCKWYNQETGYCEFHKKWHIKTTPDAVCGRFKDNLKSLH